MLRCVVCGGMVTERDDLTADGLRCAGCSMRSEIEGHERNIVEAAEKRRQRNLYRRADWIGWAHGIVWVATAALFCRHHDGWLFTLYGLAIGVRIALFRRQRWSMLLALGLDGGMIVAAFALALLRWTSDAFVGALVFSLFPLTFGMLLYSLRAAYDPASKVSPVPVAQPKPKWTSPGRQL